MSKKNNTIRREWGDANIAQGTFGIGKSTLYRLAEEGKIKWVSLRERGKLRGKRLFNFDSIAAFIEHMATQGGAKGATPEARAVPEYTAGEAMKK
jgi:hypothetical protein